MARKTRIFVEGFAQHIILYSLDDIKLFIDEKDYIFCKELLSQEKSKFDIDIHSYILMPNYIEFLLTPHKEDSISKFIQQVSRKYTIYYNNRYKRSGTLWKGRYKASLVENNELILWVMKFIETKPLYEKLSTSLKEYKYSSIHRNLFRKKDNLISFHKIYQNLGYTDKKRAKEYSKYFELTTDVKLYNFIKEALEKQLITGSDIFIRDIERKTGIKINSKRGRPKKENQHKGKTMYKNLVILNKEKHKNLKVKPITNLNFAKSLKIVPVTVSEVELVGKNFPIVFTADEKPVLVALVSLGSESLAITDEGKWITNYVPLHLRKYPFALANAGEDSTKKVILIDEDSEVFSTTEGKPLFKENLEQDEALNKAIEFLKTADEQFTLTSNVVDIIAKSGILEDREIAVGEGDDKKVLVNGFKVVNKEKLNELSDDILASWVRNGIISFIDAHIKSLENIQTLFNLAYQKQN